MRSFVNHGNCGGRHWEPVPVTEIKVGEEIRVTEIRTFRDPLTREEYTRRYIHTGTVSEKDQSTVSIKVQYTPHVFAIKGTGTRMACFEKRFRCDEMDKRDAMRRALSSSPNTVR